MASPFSHAQSHDPVPKSFCDWFADCGQRIFFCVRDFSRGFAPPAPAPDDGNLQAERVLRVQAQPGDYFTVVQIGQNAVAILGGIVGEGALSPHFSSFFELWLEPSTAQTLGFLSSFLVVTSLFILFSDLFPKRLGMATPERLAIRVAQPMALCMMLMRPLVWFYSRWADALFRLFGLSSLRDERITSDDIHRHDGSRRRRRCSGRT